MNKNSGSQVPYPKTPLNQVSATFLILPKLMWKRRSRSTIMMKLSTNRRKGFTNTGSGERYLDPNRSQPFFDLDNPNVYPPIVYPQNIQTVYPQNPCTVYPQNPHIMYPQDLKTRTAGTSSIPSFDEIFPPHYIPPRSNSSAFWKP